MSLGLAESRILPAAPADICPRTSAISFCTVQLRTLCAAHFLATLCLSTTSGPSAGEWPGFWGSMVFRHASIPRQGLGNNNNNKSRLLRQAAIHCSSLVPTELFLPAFKGNDIQMLIMCRNRGRCSKSWTMKQKRERNLKQLLKGSIKEQTRIQLG